MSRSVRFLWLVGLVGTLGSGVLTGCGDEVTPPECTDPDGCMVVGTGDLRLAFKNATGMATVAVNGDREFEVQLTTAEGVPVPQEQVEFELAGTTNGGSLAANVAVTDSEGCARVLVRAGMEATFTLGAVNKSSSDNPRLTINVSASPFTELVYTVSTAAGVDAPISVWTALFAGLSCQDVRDRDMTPTAQALAKPSLGRETRVPNLPIGGSVSLFAWGLDNDENRISQKCVDVTLNDIPTTVDVLLEEVPPTWSGTFDTQIRARILEGLPDQVQFAINTIANINDMPLTTVLDLLEEFTDIDVPDGFMNEAINRLADDAINNYIRDFLPDWANVTLETAGRIREALNNVVFYGRMQLDAPVGAETTGLTGMHTVNQYGVIVDGEERRQTTLGESGITYAINPETGEMIIDEHFLDITLGALATDIIQIVLVTVRPGTTDLAELFEETITCNSGSGFQQVLCNGLAAGLSFAAGYLDEGLDLLLGYDRVRISGTTELVDNGLNRHFDEMDEVPMGIDLQWQTTSASLTPLDFTGELSGTNEMDQPPNADTVFMNLQPMFQAL